MSSVYKFFKSTTHILLILEFSRLIHLIFQTSMLQISYHSCNSDFFFLACHIVLEKCIANIGYPFIFT